MESDRVFATERPGSVHLLASGTDNRQQKNIVVAEPDAGVALLLRDLLWQETSCDIFCVMTGEQALRLLPQVRPEFLIANSQLADMTGREMFEQLQNCKARMSLRTISLHASSLEARTSSLLPSCLDLSFGAEYLLSTALVLLTTGSQSHETMLRCLKLHSSLRLRYRGQDRAHSKSDPADA